jgi:hypothetical protein
MSVRGEDEGGAVVPKAFRNRDHRLAGGEQHTGVVVT